MEDIKDELVMYFVVRCDLESLSYSKAMGQIGHATLMSFHELYQRDIDLALDYMSSPGQPKIILKGKNLAVLEKTKAKADELGIPNFLVRDEGRTVLEPGTATILGVGPVYKSKAADVVKRLQLLKDDDMPALNWLQKA